jgi:hypothetical protein
MSYFAKHLAHEAAGKVSMTRTRRHDSPAAAAEWAADCSQRTLAVLGGRRDPWAQRIRAPSPRTFARVFTGPGAEAFNAALFGWLAAVPATRPTRCPR